MKSISPIWLSAIVFIFLRYCADVEAVGSSKSLLKTEGRNTADVLLTYRLPNDTYPESYDIKLTTANNSGETAFRGEVTIDIVVVTSTDKIVLHANGIEISNVSIASPSSRATEELSHDYELEREFLTLRSSSGKIFKAGTKWKVSIFYSGRLRDDLNGFHLVKYADENGKDRFVASTQFERTYARRAFPCYDEPAKRANFTITIHHDPNLTAISNMPVNGRLSSAGKTVFLTTARIPTYIVAFAVGEFKHSEVNANGIRLRVYSRPSRKYDHQFALNKTRSFLNYLANYFGVRYMTSKFDQLAVTKHQSGGMENWGLAIYTEEKLLYNETAGSSQMLIAFTVSHEVAHQWFGDYVTIQWWSNMWFKEGFAQLFSYQAVDRILPKWNIWERFHMVEYQEVLSGDGVKDSRPLTFYVETPAEVQSTYTKFNYYKGASVLLMWQNALGKKVFRRALRNLLKNNAYGVVTEDDLYVVLQKSAEMANLHLPASISKMMKTWTHQGNYPLLTVSRNYSDGSFTVKQETYFDDATFKDNKTWYVPINFAVASSSYFKNTRASHYLPNTTEMKVKARLAIGDWLILNKQSEYLYRIKYDEENYKLIARTLMEQPSAIPPRNRAQLLDDAFHLASTKRLSHRVLLEMMLYLRKEYHYAPWETASGIISSYKKLYNVNQFSNFVRGLVKPIFQKLGVREAPGENQLTQTLRTTIIAIACRMKVKECLVETHKRFKAHLMENATIERGLENYILSRGLVQADDNEFDAVYEKAMELNENRNTYILALSFAQNKRQIRKFISSSIDMSNTLLPAERTALLEWVYVKGEKGLLLCIEFLSKNWNAYGNLQPNADGSSPLDGDIRKMATYVLNKKVEEEFLDLVAKVKESKYVSENLESDVRSEISKNYQWLQEHGEPVKTWLSMRK